MGRKLKKRILYGLLAVLLVLECFVAGGGSSRAEGFQSPDEEIVKKESTVTEDKDSTEDKKDSTERTSEEEKARKDDSPEAGQKNKSKVDSQEDNKSQKQKNKPTSNSSKTTTATEEESSESETNNEASKLIEQVRVDIKNQETMDIYAYFHDTDNVRASWANLPEFEIGSPTLQESKGIRYYLLVDNSKSIQVEMRDAIKKALQDIFVEGIEDGDSVALLAIGDVSPDKWQGTEMQTEEKDISADIENELDFEQDNTYIYNAISTAFKEAQEVEKEKQDAKKYDFQTRSVIIIISDVDNAPNKNTGNKKCDDIEVEAEEAGIPVYSLIVKNNKADYSTNMQSMKDLSKDTGGTAYEIKDKGEVAEKLKNIMNDISSIKLLKFQADVPKLEGQTKVDLKFEFKKAKDESKTVKIDLAGIEEGDRILVKEVELVENQKLRITFSGEVCEKANTGENYTVTFQDSRDEGKKKAKYKIDYNVKKAELNEEENQVTLTLDAPLYKGKYTIKFDNITGEYNSTVIEDYPLSVSDAKLAPSKGAVFMRHNWWIMVLFLLVVVLIIFICLNVKRKAMVVVNDQTVMVTDVVQRQHVSLEQEQGIKLTFLISGGGKDSVTINAELKGSLIVGRSDLSDIFIDDPLMSRQHFAISYDNGSLYIQDLETTNGTMLNGVKLMGNQVLQPEDVVSAGNLQIKIRW